MSHTTEAVLIGVLGLGPAYLDSKMGGNCHRNFSLVKILV